MWRMEDVSTEPCHAHHCHHTAFYPAASSPSPVFGAARLSQYFSSTGGSCVLIANCFDKMISQILTFLPCMPDLYVLTRSQMCLFWHFIMEQINEEKLYLD